MPEVVPVEPLEYVPVEPVVPQLLLQPLVHWLYAARSESVPCGMLVQEEQDQQPVGAG